MSVGTAWDAITAERYDAFARRHDYYRETAADLVAHLGAGRGWEVADLGCGTGVSAAAVLKRLGPEGRVYGVDASAEMIAFARRRVVDPRVVWVAGRAEEALAGNELPEMLDATVANSVIWQMPTSVFGMLRQKMRRGAVFVFNTGADLLGMPTLLASRSLAEIVGQVARDEFGYLRPPRPPEEQYSGPRSPSELAALLVEAGFRIDEQWMYTAPPGTPESQRDWLLVPIFNQHQLRGLPDDTRLEIISRAYDLWDKDCAGPAGPLYCLRAVAT
jgi:SAM-dependent methyltransferase